jgi:hypothetical protein
MSKARDIANILSANTAIATDAEVASSVSAAVSTHATAVNGHSGRGTTANRPASPTLGDLYFDTTLNSLIAYRSAGWEKVSQDPAPQIASISPTTAATTGTVITITGSNFKSGLAVQFIGTNLTAYNSPVATFVGADTATATTPNLPVAYEPYDVKVINDDNQFAILENALDSGGSPTWNTASGTIATIAEQTALNVSVSATDPDGTLIIYSSSNLPAWMSLNSSTGALTGTAPDISSDTSYSFSITASDGVNSSSRDFNVVSTWVDPVIYATALLVAGAGGGSTLGGGGGGGGVIPSSSVSFILGNTYSVNVGAGGIGGVAQTISNGGKGGNSSLQYASGTLTAFGGGGGTSHAQGTYVSTIDGGSGGGSSNTSFLGAGSAGQGNNGGYGISDADIRSGGGGGYSSAGANASGANGGNGGQGYSLPTDIRALAPFSSISATHVGSGGGGGTRNSMGGSVGVGGTGAASGATSNTNAANPTMFGCGGGGTGQGVSSGPYGAASPGYSGVVVIKYPSTPTSPSATSTTGSPDYTVSGGYKYYTFTQNGSITF